MSRIDHPAFPVPPSTEFDAATSGMNLRDYFAAAAMQGLLASSVNEQTVNVEVTARLSYRLADEMVKASVE